MRWSLTHHFAVDGVSEELLAAGDDGAGQAERGGRLVEELEGPVVDADGVHLQEQLRPRRGRAQDLRHGDSQLMDCTTCSGQRFGLLKLRLHIPLNFISLLPSK